VDEKERGQRGKESRGARRAMGA
jgi:hypothetical protein